MEPSDARCRFCGAEIIAQEPRAVPGMRLGRAAIFAGLAIADLGAAGCTPSPYEALHPHANTAVIRGVLRDQNHRPIVGAKVWVLGVSGAPDHKYDSTTDSKGRYAVELPPGSHTIQFDVNRVHDGRVTFGGTQFPVGLEAGQVKELDPQMSISEGMAGAKPYGAPPARRRIV